MELGLETAIFSDEEIDKITEATYKLNSVARKLIFIRLGIPVKDGNLRDRVRDARKLLEGI